jgi:hypothetical protein
VAAELFHVETNSRFSQICEKRLVAMFSLMSQKIRCLSGNTDLQTVQHFKASIIYRIRPEIAGEMLD